MKKRAERFSRKLLAAVLSVAMVITMLPATAFAAGSAGGEKTTKTVTVWAVTRNPGSGGNSEIAYENVIEPTKVTVYEGTQLRYLLDDLTGKTSTYNNSGTYDGRLQTLNGGGNPGGRWRGFTKSADGTVTGYMNVRDRQVEDGDSIILTTAVSAVSESYETLPEDLSWPESVTAPKDLTAGAEAALDTLELSSILNGQQEDAVIAKLTLPKSVFYGEENYRLTWSTGDPEVISSAGVVTRPRNGQDAKVTLTAVLRDGPSKDFNLTVKAYDADEAAVLNVKDQLTWNLIKGGNASESKIISDLNLPTELKGYEGVSISWTSSNPAISSDGTVIRPANNEKDISSIKLTATVKKGSAEETVTISSLKVLKITSSEVNLDKDAAWLQETWAPANVSEEGVITDLDLPTKGEAGSTTISWTTSDESVVTAAGQIQRDEAGGETKTATLTATLKSSTYTRTVQIEIKVLPWTEAGEAEKNAKIEALQQILKDMDLPETVDALNQSAVTKIVAANRTKIEEAYQQARDAGASAAELNKIKAYQNYQNVETALRKLSKTVTISIFKVEKNADGTYSCDGSYYLPKTKVVIAGKTDGSKYNDVASAISGLTTAGVIEGGSGSSLKINGVSIGTSGDHSWRCVVNGVDRGTYSSYTAAAERQWLDHGDAVVLYFAKEGDQRFSNSDYHQPLPDSQATDYDFAEKEIADAGWLTMDRILGDNESRYSVKTNLTLPKKGRNGSAIKWSTDNADVISTGGVVTRPDWDSSDTTVTVTAVIGSGNKAQTKTFELVVKAQSISSDEKTLNYAKELLTLSGIDAVTEDLLLPETGFGGTFITWESSNPDVIGSDGTVTRPAADTQVQLTAKLSVGSYTAEKVFTATVLKAAPTDAEQVAYDKEKLTFDVIRGQNTAETSVKYDLRLPLEGIMGSGISWSSSDPECISQIGSVFLGDEEKVVTLTAVISKGRTSEEKEFRLTVPAATENEKALAAAEAAIDALPDAVSVNREKAEEVREALAAAKEKAEAAKQAGYTEAEIKNYDKIASVETKLSKLPVTMSFSIIGADIADGKVQRWKWFIEPTKLLVPAGSNMADITEAMLKGYDSVRAGSGQAYYGTIMGLSQFEGGKGSGWIYSGKGEGLDTSQGAKMSTATEGCIMYWAYTGDRADENVGSGEFQAEVMKGLPADHPIDYDLVPKPDRGPLKLLIEQAEGYQEEDYRAYGSWAGTWETMQAALAEAKSVYEAEDTALDYEIDVAAAKLSHAISALQPKDLDKSTLKKLIDIADTLQEEAYYKEGWDYFSAALEAAKDVLADDYAESGTVETITVSLQNAINRLIPVNQADKTELQAALDKAASYAEENYTLASWARLKEACLQAQSVMENINASEDDVQAALDMLERAQRSLIPLNISMQSVNEAIQQTIKKYQNTSEDWKVFDMILLGHGDQVNRQGYLVQAANLLESGKASATDLEKTAIVLTAMGYDVTKITTYDGKKIDLVEKIMEQDFEQANINAVIFALIAIDSGQYAVSEAARNNLIDSLLKTQNDDGGWPIYRGQNSDLDMTAMALSALAPYSETGSDNVDAAIASAFALLGQNKDMLCSAPGVYKGNCNTTAMAIIACAALPKNNSLLSSFENGGLRYYVTEDKQFGYMNNITGDDLATEQAVRAFAALSQYKDTGKAVNIYQFAAPTKALTLPKVELPVITADLSNQITAADKISFSAKAVTPDGRDASLEILCNGKPVTQTNGMYTASLEYGANYIVIRATGENGAVESCQYTVYRENDSIKETIHVTLSLWGDTLHGTTGGTHTLKEGGLTKWIEDTTITVDKNSTVGDVFSMILIKYGYGFDGLANGYIKSITTPEGVTLGEMDNGPLSGWMYTVNETHPNVGLNSYILQDGDTVVWHYTDDYTKEEGSDKWNTPADGEVSEVITTGASGSATTITPTQVAVSGSTATATVKAEHVTELLKQAKENKSEEIVMQVAASASKGAETVKLQLDVSAVNSIVNTTSAVITVSTENGNVTLDREILKQAVSEGNGSTITLEVVKPKTVTAEQKKAAGENAYIIQLVLKSGGKTISTFDKGQATVKVEVPTRLLDKKVAAVHIGDDGKLEVLSGKILSEGAKKYYEFTTPHFSTFALVDAEEAGLEVTDDEQAKLEKLISGVKNTKLKARSAKTSKGIKITWTKSKGYKMDYYEIFRSTKRSKGYGKKAFFSTKSTKNPAKQRYTNTKNLKKGTRYYYKVRGVRVLDGKKYYSQWSTKTWRTA